MRAWVLVAGLVVGCGGSALGPADGLLSDAEESSGLDLPDAAVTPAPDAPSGEVAVQVDAGEDVAVDAPEPIPPPAEVRLNEVECAGDEWVELVDLGAGGPLHGLALTDAPGDPDHTWTFDADAVVAPGGFVVVEGLPFGLACGTDTLQIVTLDGAMVDAVELADPPDGRTWGRLPDGDGAWAVTAPTPGGPNEPPPAPPPSLVLNEVQCRGEEWVEVHNPDPAVGGWLDGIGLTDDTDGGAEQVFEAGTWIEPGGLAVTSLLAFGIQCGEESVRLLNAAGAELDVVAVPDGPEWAAWGRLPDGGAWAETDPTPGAPNVPAVDPSDALFDPSGVTVIDITLDELAVLSLTEAPYTWVPAMVQLAVEGQEPDEALEVAVRLKGKYGSFRPLGEKSAWKVAVDAYDDDLTYRGLRNLTLNNMVQDSSVVHEHMSYALFRAFGVHAPRLGYAWVRVNGEHYGLYANIETYDEVFLGRHFESTWHLLEGEYGTDVSWDDIDDFDVDQGPGKDLSDLVALIEASDAPPSEWMAAMEGVADVEQLVRMWAVEIFTGHWDGYAPTINNYFLHSDDAGRFTMHPWGTDQTFGSWWPWYEGGGKLWNGCLAVSDCRDLYAATLAELVDLVESTDLVAVGARQAGVVVPWQQFPSLTTHSFSHTMGSVQGTLAYLHGRTAQAAEVVACLSGPDPDGDGDGFLCSSDCDDDDPTVHPGAFDVCGDLVDQDCDGEADNGPGCPECVTLLRGDRPYLFCYGERSWSEARVHCHEQGEALGLEMDLAVLTAPGEAAWLHGATQALKPGDYWMGLSDTADEGEMTWVDGQPEGWAQWQPGEPNDWGDNEDCAGVYDTGMWNDWPCDHHMASVCEPACEVGTDEDGDGADACDVDCDDGDADLSPQALDVCGDGLDQDCSGHADDAPGCGVCEELWRGPHRYLACGEPRTWQDARALCEAEGADLVILDGAAEAGWALDASGDHLGGDRWIGLNDRMDEGSFVWWDGTTGTYSAWNAGEPNDAGGEDCTVLLPNGLWNDLPCDALRPAVCEDVCAPGEDADGDGALRCGADCDDGDPALHPGAVDLCDDGVDQDCNGVVDDGPGCEVSVCAPVEAGDFSGHLCDDHRSWADARAQCQALGGDLAWFDDLGQQIHARAVVSGVLGVDGDLWVGLTDAAHEGAWVWSASDEPVDWEAWAPGQPSNGGGAGQHCGHVEWDALWDDSPCDTPRPALCRSVL